MIDLSKKIGFKVLFNETANSLEFGDDVSFTKAWEKSLSSSTIPNEPVWKSFRFAKDFTDDKGNITNEPDLSKFVKDPNKKTYFGNNGIFLKEFQEIIKSKNIIPDITILPSLMNGDEFNRTEGHVHLSGTPEIYETIYGENIYLLFKCSNENPEDIEDVLAIFAEPGDHVVFPPYYHPFNINIGSTPFIMTDYNSKNANSNFMFIKKYNGAPYWVLKDKNGKLKFEKNLKYKGKVPDIRKVKPVDEIKEFGLKKNIPMFDLVKEDKIDLLNFLNESPDKYSDIYNKIYFSID